MRRIFSGELHHESAHRGGFYHEETAIKNLGPRKTRQRVLDSEPEAPMWPEEAAECLQALRESGMDEPQIADNLGIRMSYLSRLPDASYWKNQNGVLPKKTARTLRRLAAEHKSYVHLVIEYLSSLDPGDEYWLLSGGPVIEFTRGDLRQAIIAAATKGVKVRYLFPDPDDVLHMLKASELELRAIIPSDLTQLYRAFLGRLRDDALQLGKKQADRVTKNVDVYRHKVFCLCTPWSKLIFVRRSDPADSEARQEVVPGQAGGIGDFDRFEWPRISIDPEVLGRVLDNLIRDVDRCTPVLCSPE